MIECSFFFRVLILPDFLHYHACTKLPVPVTIHYAYLPTYQDSDINDSTSSSMVFGTHYKICIVSVLCTAAGCHIANCNGMIM